MQSTRKVRQVGQVRERREVRHVGADPYEVWAPSYPPWPHNALMEVEQAAVLDLLPDMEGLTALDAGCGTGRYTHLLLERGARRVVGVDRSAAMLDRSVAGLIRLRADLAALSLRDESFDVIVSGLALADVADLPKVVHEWARVLRPGGVVVMSTLHPRGQALGWRRTFDSPRGPGALEARWHTVASMRHACQAAGLSVEVVVEPSLGGEDNRPVALVVRARQGNRTTDSARSC
ncbi:MAG: class I SAM-dependent methyltransferase [Acidobacteriota bacterium]